MEEFITQIQIWFPLKRSDQIKKIYWRRTFVILAYKQQIMWIS